MSPRLIYALQWVSWNTALAMIPVIAAYYIRRLSVQFGRGLKARLLAVLLGVIWLAFLPNTCYLLTEWRHFLDAVGYSQLFARWKNDSRSALELATYMMFYLAYSGVGVLTFTLAIRPIAMSARERGATLWVWGFPFFLAMAVGVYMGLVLRFNSWDLFLRPTQVWAVAIALIHRPVLNMFILGFAVFLWLVYLAMDIWVDGFQMRLNRYLSK